MDILSLKRDAISKLPPIHCICDKPLFEGDYVVGLHYWCNDNHDYFFSEENAYFDGKEFHLYDINLQDNANWIDDGYILLLLGDMMVAKNIFVK